VWRILYPRAYGHLVISDCSSLARERNGNALLHDTSWLVFQKLFPISTIHIGQGDGCIPVPSAAVDRVVGSVRIP
jgi:hypothetical protein